MFQSCPANRSATFSTVAPILSSPALWKPNTDASSCAMGKILFRHFVTASSISDLPVGSGPRRVKSSPSNSSKSCPLVVDGSEAKSAANLCEEEGFS